MRAIKLVTLASVLLAGCASLDATNPNAPDTKRVLSDPTVLEAVAGGTMRTWFTAYDSCYGNCVLITQAQSVSASWNNFDLNFYSSLDEDGSRRTRGWQNTQGARIGESISLPWFNMYSAISSAADVLYAIRTTGAKLPTPADTKRAETIAELMLGAGLSYIALNYDKGYVLDETNRTATLAYANRKQMRDAAVAKLSSAARLASGAPAFNTPAAWTNGISYSSAQIAQIANTLAAITLGYSPRDAAENASVNWSQVISFTQAGMSSGAPVDFVFVGDGCVAWCPEVLTWFDAIDTGRLHTRVSNMLDSSTQRTPYPAGGNAQPRSPDRRLGDGSFGDASIVEVFGTTPRTANAGTDFAWSSVELFRPTRGTYHQSNIGFVRYDLSRNQDATGIWGGFGPAPVVSATQNDLLWAEALIRSGGSLATAASLINKTRVVRGGLSPATAADGAAGLITKLGYEMEIELIGLGPAPFYWRRRADGLIAGTPREMPVPARELGVKGEPIYTFGGTGLPNSPTPP